MGKNAESVCRRCRAEGAKLFLKGKRCLSANCSVEKRNYPPGIKGKKASFRKTHYKIQLREKQKVKRFYLVDEKQFRRLFAEASRRKGITGTNLLQLLELKLDNIVYRLNLAYSRAHARQLIRHGFIAVNGKKVTAPSYIVNLNDEISLRQRALNNEKLKAVFEDIKGITEVPGWLILDRENFKGKVNHLPNREEISLQDVQERLIVELYSK